MRARAWAAALLLTSLVAGCGEGVQTATSTNVKPSCPVDYPGGVPEKATGFDASTALAPTAVPTSVLVCRYPQADQSDPRTRVDLASGTTTESGLVVTDLERLAADLQVPAALPGQVKACTAIGGPIVPVLARLAYADGGVVWLSTATEPNECQGVTNGEFRSMVYLAYRLDEARTTGTWPRAPQQTCQGLPRPGQEKRLLVAGWTSLSLCTYRSGEPEVRPLAAATSTAVADLLDDVDLSPSTNGCSGDSTPQRELLADYPDGRRAVVGVHLGCHPDVDNQFSAATLTAEQQARLEELIGS